MPNPATNFTSIRIENSEAKKITMVVTDVYGKIILEAACNHTQINLNLEHYSAGIYYVHLVDARGNKAIKNW